MERTATTHASASPVKARPRLLGRLHELIADLPPAPVAGDRYVPTRKPARAPLTSKRLGKLGVVLSFLTLHPTTAPKPPAKPKPAKKPEHHPMRVRDLPRHMNVNYGGSGPDTPSLNVNALEGSVGHYRFTERNGKLLADLVKSGTWFDSRGRLKYNAHQLADILSAPYRDTLGGRRPGGADMVAFDEINDRLNVAPNTFAEALRLVKKGYPDRPLLLYLSHPDKLSPTLLKAAEKYGDRVMVEMYRWESDAGPGGKMTPAAFDEFLRPIQRTAPGILNKIIPILGVDQRPGVYDFDNRSSVNFKHFLNEEAHALKNHPLMKHMRGLGNYPAYGADDSTRQWLSKLARWYGNTGHHALMKE